MTERKSGKTASQSRAALLKTTFTFLVIDDSDTMLAHVKSLLEQGGHTALVTKDWISANKIVHQQHPDVLVIDEHLGGFQGTFLVRAFRSFFGNSLPIITISSADVAEAAYAAGATAFVPKSALDNLLPLALRILRCPAFGECKLAISELGFVCRDGEACKRTGA